MNKTPLTVAGAEKLRTELHRLKTVERPSVIAAIAEARSHGDLSENAEYEAAKDRQGFIEGRIMEVESKLANAQIIDPKLLDADGRCVFGATVELEDMDSGQIVTYQIVGDDEADIKDNKISISSPIARALIGKYAGDVAEVKAPGGVREYELTLAYPKDANAEAHRVSIFSPAGSALLGLSAGQSIDWKASDGKEIRLKVIEVTWQPEANGQFEL